MTTAFAIQNRQARQLGLGDGEPENVEATFLCADVVDFSSMVERFGDRRVLGIMRLLAEFVKGEATLRGGEILEIRGDSFLLAFARPTAALACAIRLRAVLASGTQPLDADAPDLQVELRTALHTGDALRDDHGYFGRNLILAYRLLDRTRAGNISLSSETARRIPLDGRLLAWPWEIFRPKGNRTNVTFLQLGTECPASRPLSVPRLARRLAPPSFLGRAMARAASTSVNLGVQNAE